MNPIFRLVIFTILLNIATGIVLVSVTDSGIYGDEGEPIFDSRDGTTFGMTYNETYIKTFTDDMNSSVNPTGDLEDRDNAIYRVLDKMNLGFLTRIKDTITNYLFGFVKMLKSTIGVFMEPNVRDFVFARITNMVFIGYLVGVWLLFTGRAFDD